MEPIQQVNELTKQAKEFKNAYARKYREDNKEQQREYYKKYRQEHKEEIKNYNNSYWERKAVQ